MGFAVLTLLTFSLEPYINDPTSRKIVTGATTLYEYSFFAYFIWSNITNKKFKRAILIASALFFLFLLFYYTNTKLKRVDSFPIGVESILILIFSFYFFYQEINNPEVLFIYNDYKFWITTGIMIYISGSFFIYIFANQIPKDQLAQYWSFTYLFLGIMNILFSVGILILGLNPKQKHHTKPKPTANHHYLDIT